MITREKQGWIYGNTHLNSWLGMFYLNTWICAEGDKLSGNKIQKQGWKLGRTYFFFYCKCKTLSACETEGLAGTQRQGVISEYRSTVQQNELVLWSLFLCPVTKGGIWVWSLDGSPKEAEACVQQFQPRAGSRHGQPCSSLLCSVTSWPPPHHPLSLTRALFWL